MSCFPWNLCRKYTKRITSITSLLFIYRLWWYRPFQKESDHIFPPKPRSSPSFGTLNLRFRENHWMDPVDISQIKDVTHLRWHETFLKGNGDIYMYIMYYSIENISKKLCVFNYCSMLIVIEVLFCCMSCHHSHIFEHIYLSKTDSNVQKKGVHGYFLPENAWKRQTKKSLA